MKRKTNVSVLDANGIKRKVDMMVGENGSNNSGVILDANATEKMINDKINNLVGGAAEALDTLKEIGDAIPTKTSQLTNDAGFITAYVIPHGILANIPNSGDYVGQPYFCTDQHATDSNYWGIMLYWTGERWIDCNGVAYTESHAVGPASDEVVSTWVDPNPSDENEIA